MKLMIIGYARHGKDTVAKLIAQLTGMRFTSSSMFCAEKVMIPAFKELGCHYKDAQTCFEDRINYRKFWFDEISRYNNPPYRIVQEIFEKHDIYVGLRSRREFNAGQNLGLWHYSIWVDRSKHLTPEPEESNDLQPWMADFVVDNNGTLAELCDRVKELVHHLQELHHEELRRVYR